MAADPVTIMNWAVWAAEHLHIPAIVFGIWRLSRFFSKVETRVLTAEANLNTLSTNHFPHMEASLANQDNLLKSMDTSLKTIATQTKRTAAKVRSVKKK